MNAIVNTLRGVRLSICSPLVCSLFMLSLAGCGGGGSSGPPQVAAVTLTAAASMVMVGQQIQLSATTTDAMGNVLSGRAVTWTSNNTALATVDATGLVKALALGQVAITATSEGQSGTANVTTTVGLLFASVSAGANHTCGVTPDGVGYCWGDNSSGQLGNGTLTNSATPVPVSGALSFQSISAGGRHTCGVTSYPTNISLAGGAVYCWGDNSSGQLGNGTLTNSATPVVVLGGGTFRFVSAGSQHTCDVSTGAALYCWGDNTFGQLGNGTRTSATMPVAVSGGPTNLVSAGSSHTCGADIMFGHAIGGSAVYCWGDNSAGQLGNGTMTSSNVPVLVTSLGIPSSSVTAGTLFSCTRYHFSSNARCWGINTDGQLGNGTANSSSLPVAVVLPTSATAPAFDSGSISAGAKHACSGTSEHTTLYCWGNNSSGQLGDGTTTNHATPTVVAGDLAFYSVSSGGRHTCGVTAGIFNQFDFVSGAVYCWGDNSSGQLGNSWTTSSSVPVNVARP